MNKENSNIEKLTEKKTSRRNVLKMGVVGGAIGAASLALGSVPSAVANIRAKAGTTKEMVATDIDVVNGAIQLEQKAINTYQTAAKAGLLPTAAFKDVALQFAADHTAHRNKLMEAVNGPLGGKSAEISNLGTFPIPKIVMSGAEADVLRYALTLEMLASKTYLDAITNKLSTDAAKDLAATILPVETQHAAVFRAVLMVILKTNGIKGDIKLVPHPFLDEFATPPVPTAG